MQEVQAHLKRTKGRNVETAVLGGTFSTPCAHQHTAETAGSRAHVERTGSRNVETAVPGGTFTIHAPLGRR
jgi:hypothetical protein